MATNIPGSGLWGDIANTINDNFSDLESDLSSKADSASLGALASKNDVAVGDIDATGTADNTTFLRGDGTWASPPGGGGAVWGSITGTLGDQVDLQAALALKANASSLAAVATSGDYDDLSNKPVLSTVATTGDYDDLINKPVLGALASKNDVAVGDIDATGTADNTTFLRGDGTWASPPGGGGAVWGSITGTLADQADLQAALAAKASLSVLADVATSGDYDDLSNKPVFAAVAFTGDYYDLSNKPILGALASKNDVAVGDIDASGTADNTTFLRGDGTWASPPGGGGAVWGSITGTLADQADLQAAFLRSDAASAKTTGNLTMNDSIRLELGTSGGESSIYSDATNTLWDMLSGDLLIRDNITTRFTLSRTTGNFTATGDVSANSDIRLKENIELITDALSKVKQINGYTFDRVDTKQRQAGVIAQEVREVLPEVVRQDERGMLTVAYGNMVGLLIEAVKDLSAEVEELRNAIAK